MARESLKSWQESNEPWLELSDVYKRTTNNIRVTVIPFYIGIKEEQRKKLFWVIKRNFFFRKKYNFDLKL